MGSKYTQLEKLSCVCGSDLSIILLYPLKTWKLAWKETEPLWKDERVNFVQIKNAVSSAPGTFCLV